MSEVDRIAKYDSAKEIMRKKALSIGISAHQIDIVIDSILRDRTHPIIKLFKWIKNKSWSLALRIARPITKEKNK